MKFIYLFMLHHDTVIYIYICCGSVLFEKGLLFTYEFYFNFIVYSVLLQSGLNYNGARIDNHTCF